MYWCSDGDRGDADPEEPGGALGVVAGGGDDVLGADDFLVVGRDQVAAAVLHARDGHAPVVAGPFVAVHLPLALDGEARAGRAPLAMAWVTSAGLM
jgi:hypothetical protein